MLQNNATASSDLSTEIKWALEDNLNRLCMRADIPAFRKEHDFTVSTGSASYEMPADFYRIIEPGLKFTEDPNWTLEWFDQQDFDRVGGDWRFQNNSRPRNYTIRGRDEFTGRFMLKVSPKPDQNYTMVLPYFSTPQRIATAGDNDSVDKRFPPSWWKVIAFGAAMDFPQYLTERQRRSYEARYTEGAILITQTSSPVVGRMYQNRRYQGAQTRGGVTWGMTGTDIIDAQGNAL